MENIRLPDSREHRLTFYLAMEEYVAAAFGCGFFVWSVLPTVIFGRHQDMESEVNQQYCIEHGVTLVRRKSGGGCVYADKGNLMLSYITPQTGVEAVFGEYLDKLASFLRSLGLNAVKTEHNDVLVDGHKVSGNAFFVHPKASIVHGTLLYDVDMEAMQHAITPSSVKLAKHSVSSVRQRVGNLVDLGLDMPEDELVERLENAFCDSRRVLDPEDIREIEALEESYLDPTFIVGKA